METEVGPLAVQPDQIDTDEIEVYGDDNVANDDDDDDVDDDVDDDEADC